MVFAHITQFTSQPFVYDTFVFCIVFLFVLGKHLEELKWFIALIWYKPHTYAKWKGIPLYKNYLLHHLFFYQWKFTHRCRTIDLIVLPLTTQMNTINHFRLVGLNQFSHFNMQISLHVNISLITMLSPMLWDTRCTRSIVKSTLKIMTYYGCV